MYTDTDTTILRWEPKSKVDTCTASGGWSGSKTPGKDSEVVGPYAASGTYAFILECTDPDGVSVSESRSLEVVAHPQVNGSCGLANNTKKLVMPTTNLCFTTGTAPVVTGNTLTHRWEWTCTGINGGTSQNCSASSAQIRFVDY